MLYKENALAVMIRKMAATLPQKVLFSSQDVPEETRDRLCLLQGHHTKIKVGESVMALRSSDVW